MLSATYTPGQRVFAPAEPHLGLGMVLERSGRRFDVVFPKTEERRTYSLDTEALVRFRAKPGDSITDQHGDRHHVVEVRDDGEVLIYLTSGGEEVPELALSPEVERPDPFTELALGRPGSPTDFSRRLRAHRLKARGRSQQRRGLGAARVELLPHQLFVTERVAGMWRPRVLLADEVGLGKTVEAGLIAARLAALGRISSVAVVAPRALVGQWLAEFYRRFARPLTLFDPDGEEELPQDMLIPADDLEFLPADFSRHLLIVDEAHHYAEDRALAVLAERSRAVLLLSATPSLGGEDRLFKLLHLLDPLRYPDTESLQRTAHRWQEVARLARSVEEGTAGDGLESTLKTLFPEETDLHALSDPEHSEQLLERLVDRHGLGRSLIRNRRRRLHDLFAGRKMEAHHLEEGESLETFLVEKLKELAAQGKKALVMVSTPQEVSRWAGVLARNSTLLVARFDESMSLLERDRQAAWFNRVAPDPSEGEGASVLICSEVGGEGRNFQVAHHLLMLDLPRHPDRLEQRIGRLDRIGQTREVVVHVPLPAGDQVGKVRLGWLHEGLDAFSRPLSEGDTLYKEHADELDKWEKEGPGSDFSAWLEQVREQARRHEEQARKAVDPLVDRMSFDERRANELAQAVGKDHEEMTGLLQEELAELLDSLGVMMEAQTDSHLYTIRAGDMMFVESLPGLPPGGTLVTLDREVANRRDDVDFLHFEHRMVGATLDLILDEGVGRATAARWRGAPRTTVAFQMLFLLESEAAPELGMDRFLPARTVVLTGDLSGQLAVGDKLPGGGELDVTALERLGPEVVETLLARSKELRPELCRKAREQLAGSVEKLRQTARDTALEFFSAEQARLEHLARGETPEGLHQQAHSELAALRSQVMSAIDEVDWRFDAVRMILCQE